MRRDLRHPAGGAASAAGPGPGRYEIRLLGTFTVCRDGAPVPGQQVGSRKARTLLKRLLVERDRIVGTDALAEVVWPQRLPDEPARQVATLVSRLRATLGSDVIVRAGEGYRFGGGPAYLVDVDEAERLATEAAARLVAGEAGLARSAAGRALELLRRGELLADEPDAPWAAPARAAAEGLLRRTRRSAWTAALALGDLDLVVRTAEAALAAEPYLEDACRALMRAHQQRGEPGLALLAFARVRAALAEHLGADPAEETRALHLEILRSDPGRGSALPHHQGGLGSAPRHPAGVAASRQARPGRRAAPPHPLVGRDTELAWLHRAWSAATSGTAGLLLLVGEAGIGKTTLAAEAVALARSTGGLVAEARCYEAERSLFLQPVAEALAGVVAAADPALVREAAAGHRAGSLVELVGELLQVLGAPDYRPADPEVERRRMFEAAAEFILRLAGRCPTLVFLDDLHLAGSSTWEFLHFLMRRATGSQVLVLATVRAEECGDVVEVLGELASRWDLGPLPEAAVGELARRGGAAELAGQIMARTRGHSLYVVESLRALAEQPAGSSPAVPDSLRDAVLARMRRAGPEVDELLRAAATLGSGIDPVQLAALMEAPVARVARWLGTATAARLVAEAGAGYEFANDLIREIAYEVTPLPIRIARHRHAATLLRDNPEAVAWHAVRAADWPAAVQACLRAAERAAGRYANREAERLLEQAVQAAVRAGDPAGVARARLARGPVREALADYQGAYEDLSAVVAWARAHQRPDLELAALNQLGGDLLVGVQRPTHECIPYLEAALPLAEAMGDVPTQVDLLGRLAVIWTNRLRFDQARAQAERAVALAASAPGEAVQLLALDAVKTTYAYRGEVSELEALLPRLQGSLAGHRQHLRHYRKSQLEAWVVFESAFPALARAQWSDAATRIEQALAITRENGYVAYQAPFLAHLAWVERARGNYGEAVRRGRQAADLADQTGHPWWVALAGTMLGWVLTELGALDEAAQRLQWGMAAAERDATEGYLLRAVAHLAWTSCLRGEQVRATVLAQRAEQLLAPVTGPAGMTFLHGAHAGLATAEVRLAYGEAGAAERLLGPIRAAAAGAGWVETVAWADLLAARCARASAQPDRAAVRARQALRAAQAHQLPGIAARAHAELASLAGRSAGEHAAAAAIVDRLAGSLDDPALRATYLAYARAEPPLAR